MRLVKQLGAVVFWFSLWAAIPATLLYPLALWMVSHTRISARALAQSYAVAIGLLFLPTGFLIDHIYRRLIRDRYSKKRAEASDTSK
jgi:hypothetical protein